MILADATEAIYEAFLASWAASHPDVQVATDNDAFTPPEDGSAWVRLAVRTDVTVQETVAGNGQAHIRTRGRVIVQVFTPRDQGRAASDALVASVKAALQRKTLTRGSAVGNANQILLFATTPREIGNDGPWFNVNCATPFLFDEVG